MVLTTTEILAGGGMAIFYPASIWFAAHMGRRQAMLDKITRPDIQRYMHRVVNAEEADERYNLTRKMLHDAKRRTMPRPDSGKEARVSKMRVRRRVVRRPLRPAVEADG
jgi:hypothetical protein